MKEVRVWDLPTRLFHWLLVAAIAAAYVTGESGGNALIWHGWLGLFIVGLITFRLVWGIAGSTHARFATFVRGPAAIKAYLAGQWHGPGHNPLGALSVVGLLLLVTLQLGSGLFASNDDTGLAGPFYAQVGSFLGGVATRLHHKIFDLLAILIGLHIAAILFYGGVKKEKLLKAMITGRKAVSAGDHAEGGGLLAVGVALAIAAGVTYGASGAWMTTSGATIVSETAAR